MVKCKTGFKRKGNICIPERELIKSSTKKAGIIIKLALIGSLVSIGGWALFTAIIKIFKMENLNPYLMGFVGLMIILITTFFGWKKLK